MRQCEAVSAHLQSYCEAEPCPATSQSVALQSWAGLYRQTVVRTRTRCQIRTFLYKTSFSSTINIELIHSPEMFDPVLVRDEAVDCIARSAE